MNRPQQRLGRNVRKADAPKSGRAPTWPTSGSNTRPALTDGTRAIPPLGAHASRAEQVYEALRAALLSGAFPPGHQLHEGDIAAQLGVSKTPVREAISTLRGKGLLIPNPTRGIMVASIADEEIQELYEVRSLLEPEAVRCATPYADDDLVKRGRVLLDEAARCGERRDFVVLSQVNREFHELLYERCGNRRLKAMLNDMRDIFQLLAATSWRGVSPTWERERTQHRQILEAVASGDADEAELVSRRHLEDAVARITGAGGHRLTEDDQLLEEVGPWPKN